MVTPLEVYLVLQLDSIKALVCWVSGIGAFGTAVASIAGFFAHAEGDEVGTQVLRFARKFFIVAIFGLFVGVALPSTKTAAAMILLPALTSKEVTEPLSREAGELYDLAKSALRNAASKPEPKPEPEE